MSASTGHCSPERTAADWTGTPRFRAALDVGCSLRDVQHFARHADPRQIRRYDGAR